MDIIHIQLIKQLIGDIRDNDWVCIQDTGESDMGEWEKEIIIRGLEGLLKGDKK